MVFRGIWSEWQMSGFLQEEHEDRGSTGSLKEWIVFKVQ